MVPQIQSVGQQRYQTLARQNASSSSLFVQEPTNRPRSPGRPLVTYGKSSRPLSLTGKQFRKSSYDIPSDDDDQDEEADAPRETTLRRDNHSSDSPLSDAESVAAPQSEEASCLLRGPSKVDVLEAAALATRSLNAVTSTAQTKRGTAKAVPKPRLKPVYPAESPTNRGTVRDGKSETAKKRSARATPVLPKQPSKKAKTLARRLPVNELMLVASAPQYDDLIDPLSSAPGVQTQDPIRDLSSQPRRRNVSSISADSTSDRPRPKAPLTAIRKRLKTPKFRHKVVKRKPTEQPLFFGPRTPQVITGDGFDETELHIDYRVMPRKQRKRQAQGQITYNALQLSSGPLPDVTFECSTDELQLEPSGGPHHVSQRPRGSRDKPCAPPVRPVKPLRRMSTDELQLEPHGGRHHISQTPAQTERFSHQARRKVSFSDREQLIIAQLSSISAPEREWSVSEDGDGDDEANMEEGENDEEESQTRDERVSDADGDEALLSDEDLARSTPRQSESPSRVRSRTGMIIDDDRRVEDIENDPEDMRLCPDFRKPATPGTLPRRSFGKRYLIEVNEAIVDASEPDTVQVPRSDLTTARTDEEEEIVDITSHRPHRRRPRSILKPSTPMVPDSTYRPEDTAANTRRNSTIVAEDSRYFSHAADVLRSPDPEQHRIMPRRSSYFNSEAYVQIADSEQPIPETSLETPDYTNATQLNVLRQSSETGWTSQSLPTVPKDLRSLTRTVSREHGTVSQSLRRRSSLPFQSPTKVR